MDGKLSAGDSLLSHSRAGVDGGEGLGLVVTTVKQEKHRVVRGDPWERDNLGLLGSRWRSVDGGGNDLKEAKCSDY